MHVKFGTRWGCLGSGATDLDTVPHQAQRRRQAAASGFCRVRFLAACLNMRCLALRTTLDARGTLWLDASEDDHEAWADFLGGVDLAYAASKAEAAAALRRMEGAVASAAGLAMVFASAGLSATPGYRWAALSVDEWLQHHCCVLAVLCLPSKQ